MVEGRSETEGRVKGRETRWTKSVEAKRALNVDLDLDWARKASTHAGACLSEEQLTWCSVGMPIDTTLLRPIDVL